MQAEGIVEDDQWDAGDLGCGELVIHLRTRLRAMPGKVLKLIARDPGAPADIPAYCRMTGHQLLREDPATFCYWIRARVEQPK
jgi:tRNA 2-thiouridine synthesizing protein A